MGKSCWLITLARRCFWAQYRFYTSTMTSLLVPPESVRGMTCLNRAAFETTVELPCLRYRDINISKIKPVFKKYLFRMRNFKPIQKENDEVIMYLNPLLIKCVEDFVEEEKGLLEDYKCFGMTKVTLNYDNWNSYDMLKAILPEGIKIPTSYSLVGHIVHLNLREVHLPYKIIIGQIYLDTIPTAKTVVNKINIIDTTFRHFSMEILAGDKNTITTVKEHGCTYELDFSQVYWNPRLSTEHTNLITFMKVNDVLYDVFAGVGPFAIPAARKRIEVFANDLNPEAYKWLQRNIKINKVEANVKSFNMDGRDFLRSVVKTDILNRRVNNKAGCEHIVMNLPALAVEFLDVFFNWFNSDEIEQMCYQPPIVHLYCFVKANKNEDACKVARSLVEEKLGCTLNSDSLVNVHYVRNVAPAKEMIRVSFLLTKSILKGEEPAMKKLKMKNNLNEPTNDNIPENNGKEQRNAKKAKEQECLQSSDCS